MRTRSSNKTTIWSLARIWLAAILIITACGSDDGGNSGGEISSSSVETNNNLSSSSSDGTTQSSSSDEEISSSSDAGTNEDSSSSIVPSSSSDAPSSSSDTSSSSSSIETEFEYEGYTYKVVPIGSQIWMAENLRVDVEGSSCYESETSNCEIYGMLYDYAAAMDLPASCNEENCDSLVQEENHQGVCPPDWHIPSPDEWDALVKYIENENDGGAGKHLKATSGWDNNGDKNGNGDDTYGFAALPGGYAFSADKGNYIGSIGSWRSTGSVIIRRIFNYADWLESTGFSKGMLFSVRCIKN